MSRFMGARPFEEGREILPFCDRNISADRRKRRGKSCAPGKAERDVERRHDGKREGTCGG